MRAQRPRASSPCGAVSPSVDVLDISANCGAHRRGMRAMLQQTPKLPVMGRSVMAASPSTDAVSESQPFSIICLSSQDLADLPRSKCRGLSALRPSV
jgi:hypothetical protein